ncbi:hypothetical protein [Rhodoblastus sp.]|uniref:hypothetical protein n=1 Tax=Rhodoblastus sp. TaxID=1962975 RepID=UPI003F9BB9DD
MAEIKPFKPETGADARAFETFWCENCAKHAGGAGCWILLATSVYDPEDPEYPESWRIGDDGPECAAFEPDLRRVS